MWSNKVKLLLLVLVATLVFAGIYKVSGNEEETNQGGIIKIEEQAAQTDVDQAKHLFNDDGVPYLLIENVGKQNHPAWTGLYALEYLDSGEMEKFWACVEWLEDNLKKSGDHYVWLYNFDSTYNDIEIKAPWFSGFGQALGIEAFVAAYQESNDKKYLNLANKAAEMLFVSINEGGLMYRNENDVWFEEIPVPKENPSHILNGNMRALIAIHKLAEATGNSEYKAWYEKGVATLEKWLPLYDTGYWLSYDLNRKKRDLLFRFNNPYGFQLQDLAIDKITLKDPLTNDEVVLNVGESGDGGEGPRIAGNDWGQPGILDERTIRRLKQVSPSPLQDEMNGEFHSPGTYFYLDLPSEWTNNLRSDWFELSVHYKDEKAGNISVQGRSIAPGIAFRDIRDGELLLTGSGEWREWKIPIRVSDLAYWVGSSYGEKHLEYLKILSASSPELKPWVEKMKGYLELSLPFDLNKTKVITSRDWKLPVQTPMLPVYSLDEYGVVRQHISTPNSDLKNGSWDGTGEVGPPIYSPFIIAQQALLGSKMFDPNDFVNHPAQYKINIEGVRKEPAIQWIKENKKVLENNSAAVWQFEMDNSYNDMVQKAPWASAFSQAFVLDALMREGKNPDLLEKGALAYNMLTSKGGLSTLSKEKHIFFEEVPNKSHILNAHLVSTAVLHKVSEELKNDEIKELANRGLKSLKSLLYQFDTGYWSLYDQNPMKRKLFQLDWLSGDKSPLISDIYFENPQTNEATYIQVGSSKAFAGESRLAGLDWGQHEKMDGKVGRRFNNGYALRSEPVSGGHVHNVFFNLALPNVNDDLFDNPVYRLVINYKDDVKGEFVIKTQSINEGNNLEFMPVKNAKLITVGDGKWKQAVFYIRGSDLGWFMGPDYQQFHIEKLEEIASYTNDWFFKQYSGKWKYYLEQQQEGNKAIIIEQGQGVNLLNDIKVIDSSKTYPGFEVVNALDGDPDDDYAAFLEGGLPQHMTFDLGGKKNISSIELIWESETNYGVDYTVEAISDDKISTSSKYEYMSGMVQKITFKEPNSAVDRLKIVVTKTHGQDRILLRQIKIYTK